MQRERERERETFLEIGFNNGEMLKAMSQHYSKAKFVGIEVREAPVQTLCAEGYDCRLVQEELFKTDEKFDVIYGFAVIHHLSNPYEALSHYYSMLKPGGILMFQHEGHILDVTSMLYITLFTSWKYEMGIFKISKNKMRKFLKGISKNCYAIYNGAPFLDGFLKINSLYRKLYLHRLPVLNSLTIFAQKDT